MEMMYIYKTTNLIDGKIYIGQKSKKLNDNEYYGSGILIKQAINKYGKENFKKEIIEYCENKKELDLKEQYWIKKLKTRDLKIGYNIQCGGLGGDTLSTHPKRNEIIQKISMAGIGRLCTKETKQKLSDGKKGEKNPMYGKHHTEEHRKKQSNALKGKPKTAEHAKHIGESRKGKHHTKEGRKNISEGHKGQKAWNKGIKCPQWSGEKHWRNKNKEIKL